MNYQAVEETIRDGYRKASEQYRRDDEIEVTTENHRRISATLKQICSSFPHPITALEAGCGSGRYFHALTNVEELVGMDITDEMLRAAENPVRRDEITVKKIRLIRGNIYLTSFPPESFDFIYALGMFGNGCPVTVDLCNKFYEWLKPGGKLLFNAVDMAGMPSWYRAWRQTRELVYPLLTPGLKKLLDERHAKHPYFIMTPRALRDILKQTRFADFELTSHVCQSPLWTGRHLECIAQKPKQAAVRDTGSNADLVSVPSAQS
jgi:SAM-dependent methyltransferase